VRKFPLERMRDMNCHGCKHLDRYKEDGDGYCSRVVRSKSYQPQRVENGKLMNSSCVRRPDMERCELYAAGDYATRYDEE